MDWLNSEEEKLLRLRSGRTGSEQEVWTSRRLQVTVVTFRKRSRIAGVLQVRPSPGSGLTTKKKKHALKEV